MGEYELNSKVNILFRIHVIVMMRTTDQLLNLNQNNEMFPQQS